MKSTARAGIVRAMGGKTVTISSQPGTPAGDPGDKDTPRRTRSAASLGRWGVGLAAVCLLIGGAYFFMTGAGPGAGGAQPRTDKKGPPPSARNAAVAVAAARTGDVGVYLNGLGSVVPGNTVNVKSRVDGQIMKILFREGQDVGVGDPLVIIDPRPFQAQLTQAEGQTARDRAMLKNALLDLERFKALSARDLIPRQQLDTQEALALQYEGAVKADQGLIDNARLQLVYSRIAAPISGRIGLRQVDAGNIVHAADVNALAVITQVQPITVVFSIAEDNLPAALTAMKTALKAGTRLPVEAFDREQKKKLADGYLLSVDNRIDPGTGTVLLKAEFSNKDDALFPNQFVNARLILEVRRGAVLIPSAALQRNTKGTFVYVVKADKTVELRAVKVGVTQGDDVSVDSGPAQGEIVVVEGADRLRDGVKVDIRDSNGPETGRNNSGRKDTGRGKAEGGEGREKGDR